MESEIKPFRPYTSLGNAGLMAMARRNAADVGVLLAIKHEVSFRRTKRSREVGAAVARLLGQLGEHERPETRAPQPPQPAQVAGSAGVVVEPGVAPGREAPPVEAASSRETPPPEHREPMRAPPEPEALPDEKALPPRKSASFVESYPHAELGEAQPWPRLTKTEKKLKRKAKKRAQQARKSRRRNRQGGGG